MATLQDMEKQAQAYTAAREELAAVLSALDDETRALKKKYLVRIRALVGKAKGHRADLLAAVVDSPALFVKPKSRVLHGVKCGYGTSKAKVEIDDEAAVIKRIRTLLPANQAELLIRVEESVHKPAVYDLAEEDLKRLGIRVKEGANVAFVTDTTEAVEKMVEALLADISTEEVKA